MCASVFTALFVLSQIFYGLALFLAKIVVPVSFTGLGAYSYFIPGVWLGPGQHVLNRFGRTR